MSDSDDGRPLLVHRLAPETIINGRVDTMPRPVPCEVCGAPVFLLQAVHWCQPDRVQRKVAELDPVLHQYVRHRCGQLPVGEDLPRCQECDRAQWEWIGRLLAHADELRADAERHMAASRGYVERARKLLGRA